MVTSLSSPDRKLYRWQLDALVSWLRCGRRGPLSGICRRGQCGQNNQNAESSRKVIVDHVYAAIVRVPAVP